MLQLSPGPASATGVGDGSQQSPLFEDWRPTKRAAEPTNASQLEFRGRLDVEADHFRFTSKQVRECSLEFREVFAF